MYPVPGTVRTRTASYMFLCFDNCYLISNIDVDEMLPDPEFFEEYESTAEQSIVAHNGACPSKLQERAAAVT